MTVREIQGHIEEIYGFEASPSLISAVTGAVMDEVTAWQNRPLEPCYPVVLMHAIRVNIRSDGAVSNKAVFVALAILRCAGHPTARGTCSASGSTGPAQRPTRGPRS